MNKLTNETNPSQIKPCNYIAMVMNSESSEPCAVLLNDSSRNWLPLRLGSKDVCQFCDMSETGLWEKTNPSHKNYIPGFPKPIKEGARTYWLLSDLIAYIIRCANEVNPVVLRTTSVAANENSFYEDRSEQLDENAASQVIKLPSIKVCSYYRMENGKLAPMVICVKQVAKLLDCSVPTIWKYINEDSSCYISDFPKPFKIGGATKWLRQSIEEFVISKNEQLKGEK